MSPAKWLGLLLLLPAVCSAKEACDSALAEIGAAVRYQDDHTLLGYSDLTFTYAGEKDCDMQSENLLKNKKVSPGYFLSHSELNAEENGVRCACADNRMTISFAGADRSCTFTIQFNPDQSLKSFEGNCILTEEKQRVVTYEPMRTSNANFSASVALDEPIFLPALPGESSEPGRAAAPSQKSAQGSQGELAKFFQGLQRGDLVKVTLQDGEAVQGHFVSLRGDRSVRLQVTAGLFGGRVLPLAQIASAEWLPPPTHN